MQVAAHTSLAGETQMDRELSLPHARLRYRDEGAGPALLLIHGWTLDLDMWEPQARALADAYRVIRFDDELSRALPRCERALVPGAGHLPNLDEPGLYNALLRQFLQRFAS